MIKVTPLQPSGGWLRQQSGRLPVQQHPGLLWRERTAGSGAGKEKSFNKWLPLLFGDFRMGLANSREKCQQEEKKIEFHPVIDLNFKNEYIG